MERDWNAWIGRSEGAADTVTRGMVEAFAATLDTTADLDAGAPAPQGIHWLLAPPRAPMTELGPDGHPRRGGFLPPIEAPRRMWAASDVQFLKPIVIGDTVLRRSTIASVEAKQGSTGPLVFVGIDHRFTVGGETRIEERQTLVFRDIQPYTPPARSDEADARADFERRLTPDPVMLFRFSAITFNGHRIHYDEPYATGVELYPGIVVHAPLTASLCLDLAARQFGPNRLTRFSFRGVSPAFANESLRIAGTRGGDDVAFVASAAGRVIARARAGLGA
ncbi:MAG TPA: MaoC family dehydratase N-terminal domain-containing protein [Bauldia sp.]|nr:MaoC family dehydratase N-terminal domain-containing protein [Bauldia sp.]